MMGDRHTLQEIASTTFTHDFQAEVLRLCLIFLAQEAVDGSEEESWRSDDQAEKSDCCHDFVLQIAD